VGGRQGHVQRRHSQTGRVQAVTTVTPAATAPTATAITTTAASTLATAVVGFFIATLVVFVGRSRRSSNRANASTRDPVCGSPAPPSSTSPTPPTPISGTAAQEIRTGSAGTGAVHAATPGHGRLRVATAGQPVRCGRGRCSRVLCWRRLALLATQTRAGPAPSQRPGQPEHRRCRLFFRFQARVPSYRGRCCCRRRSRRRCSQVGRWRRRRR